MFRTALQLSKVLIECNYSHNIESEKLGPLRDFNVLGLPPIELSNQGVDLFLNLRLIAQ